MKFFYYRLYQAIMRIATNFIHWPKPQLIEGAGSVDRVKDILAKHDKHSVLIVTDAQLHKIGLLDSLCASLDGTTLAYHIYDGTVPNPTTDNVEEGLELYRTNNCDSLVAIGGGSSMDCAKGIGIRIVRPDKPLSALRGVLKVGRKLPLLIAIPTTAGTGSETTIAAVISEPAKCEKYPINDPKLVPDYAVLDALLTVGLPPHITSTTGVDALTHAVEAFIGRSNTQETEECAREAVTLIFANLGDAYRDGKNLIARENMLRASFLAGVAFTRAYVGYVHAIAHTLGAYYGTPHGLANSVILPYVLDYFGESAWPRLALLADCLGLEPNGTVEQKAKAFIAAIRSLERELNIPDKIEGILDEDIDGMIRNAMRESNPLYPVPREFDENDFRTLYETIRA